MLRIEGPPAATAAEILDRTESVARSVHDLSHRLHPARLRLIGLVAALNGLQREVSHSGMDITFTHEDVPAAVPQDLTLCLYRIVQEALQNAAKYSRAQKVTVRLGRDARQLVLVVEDNGVGFDVPKAWAKGLGLLSMRERLEALDGTFEIRSAPGAGTRLEVRVPFLADAVAAQA
jgi:signal transduction histidine kinase